MRVVVGVVVVVVFVELELVLCVGRVERVAAGNNKSISDSISSRAEESVSAADTLMRREPALSGAAANGHRFFPITNVFTHASVLLLAVSVQEVKGCNRRQQVETRGA